VVYIESVPLCLNVWPASHSCLPLSPGGLLSGYYHLFVVTRITRSSERMCDVQISYARRTAHSPLPGREQPRVDMVVCATPGPIMS
jgi:hypothetical protein